MGKNNLIFPLAFMATMLAPLASHADVRGFYIGLSNGVGSTNWSKIKTSDQFLASSMPSAATDSGHVWGVYLGDHINRYLDIKFRYQQFATSHISFAKYNEYDPPSYAAFSMNSRAHNFELVNQFSVPIRGKFSMYSLLGASYTSREDEIANVSGFGAVFGFGSKYASNRHIQQNLEFEFVTGNAAIVLAPVKHYLPFLTDITYQVEYHFT